MVLRSLPTLLAGAILLALGLLFSVVVLVVVAVFGLGLWAWLWWKTRKLRRAAREVGATAPEGQIIEGEAIVVEERRVVEGTLLPRNDA